MSRRRTLSNPRNADRRGLGKRKATRDMPTVHQRLDRIERALQELLRIARPDVEHVSVHKTTALGKTELGIAPCAVVQLEDAEHDTAVRALAADLARGFAHFDRRHEPGRARSAKRLWPRIKTFFRALRPRPTPHST